MLRLRRHVSAILGRLMHRRAFLFAILMYVTLDLSMPAMPGAFVFAPDDSVESAQNSRGRGSVEVVVLPALTKDTFVVSRSPIDSSKRLPTTIAVVPRASRVVSCPPRATLGVVPSSEDPH